MRCSQCRVLLVIHEDLTMLHVAIFVIAVSFPAALGSGNHGTREVCVKPGVEGFQCSLDCKTLGYCDTAIWIPIWPCPSGQICIDDKCEVGNLCPTSPRSNVLCTDSALKMPDLEDATCRKYYTCEKEQGEPYGYGVPQSCPVGTVFDPCSGECAVRLCPTYAPCITDLTIMEENRRLMYVCNPSFVLWAHCPNGTFLPLVGGPECIKGAISDCKNGNGTNTGSGGVGTCTTAGRLPIAGTDCGYLQCYSDLSSTAFPCRWGYHYNDTVKECVSGPCTGPPVKLQDDHRNAWTEARDRI